MILPGIRDLKRRIAAVAIAVAVAIVGAACGDSDKATSDIASATDVTIQRAVNLDCPKASGQYGRVFQVSAQEAARLLAASGLDISVPDDKMGLEVSAAETFDDGRPGLILDLGGDVDREGVALSFSSPTAFACSGPPSGALLFETEEGISVYPYQFSNSVGYIARFMAPARTTAIEASLSSAPHHEPTEVEQEAAVRRWLSAIYDANAR